MPPAFAPTPPLDTPAPRTWSNRLRRRAGAVLVDGFFSGASRAGRLLPAADPRLHGVEVLEDVPYLPDGSADHLLDVWRPIRREGPRPVVLYVHGGGFRILSKDTHWIFGLVFARRGYVVFNINYRLAPRAPFPAAIQDSCAALEWVHANAERYGGDPERMILAGESAGGNLVTSLALASSFEREEPWAARLHAAGIRPAAVLPACGMLQVSDSSRFLRARPMSRFLADRLHEVEHAYLGDAAAGISRDLADPLLVLERATPPPRRLPPFFAPVGTADPLVEDTRRLEAALARMGTTCEARYYEGEHHAFHAFVLREVARRCWRDTFDFLARQGLAAREGLEPGAEAFDGARAAGG